MTTPSWPNDLDALEAALAGRVGREPSASLRPRVLAAMTDERRRQRRANWWWYAGATAALVLLWANLSWIACRETTYNWRGEEVGDDLAADVRTIERLVPDISPREARRERWCCGVRPRGAARRPWRRCQRRTDRQLSKRYEVRGIGAVPWDT